MTAELIQRISESFATRSSRRGFFRIAAKVTGAATALGFGLTRVYQEVAANGPCSIDSQNEIGTCLLAHPDNSCVDDQGNHTCPNCPPGETNRWTWYCCNNSCLYICIECYSHSCSCAYSDGSSCGGGTCGGTRPHG